MAAPPATTAPATSLGVAKVVEQLRSNLRQTAIETLIAETGECSHMQLVPAVTRLCQNTVPKPLSLTDNDYELAVHAIISELFKPDVVQSVIDKIRKEGREKGAAARQAKKGAIAAALAGEDPDDAAVPKGRLQVAPIFPPRVENFERLLPGEVPPDISLDLEQVLPEAGTEQDKNQSTDPAPIPAPMDDGPVSILAEEDSLLGPPKRPGTPTPNQEAMPGYEPPAAVATTRTEEVPMATSVPPAKDLPSPACSDEEDKQEKEEGEEREQGEESEEEEEDPNPDDMIYAYALIRTGFADAAFYETNPETKRMLDHSWKEAKKSIGAAMNLFHEGKNPPPPREHDYVRAFCNPKNLEKLLRDIAFFLPKCFKDGELDAAIEEVGKRGHPMAWIDRYGAQKVWELVKILPNAISDHYSDPRAKRSETTGQPLDRLPPSSLLCNEWIRDGGGDDDEEDDDDFEPEPEKKTKKEKKEKSSDTGGSSKVLGSLR